jgi:serine/threonine protein kinase
MTQSTMLCGNCSAANRTTAKFCMECGSPLKAAPALLKQRYRILTAIGQGGFGAIYQAEDTHFPNHPKRAVKEMLMQSRDPHEQQQAIEAFKQEALLLAGLMHPNLPRIYEYFEEAGRWYLVMDYINGETLEDRAQASSVNKLPFQQALHFATQLCTVLDYLHNQQPPIIFRDLKPDNIMVTSDDHLYLIDFGIARLFKPGQAKDTSAFGSPGYAAPEQYGKAQTTAQADIYSLGATLHRLLSGRDPSDNPFHFSALDLTQDAPAGPICANLVERMVAMDVQKRPSSMREIKQNLQNLAQQPVISEPLSSNPEKNTFTSYTATNGPDSPPIQYSATYMPDAPPIQYSATSSRTSVDGYLNESKALVDSKRYQEALRVCEQALELYPSASLLHVNKAAALNGLARYQEALTACNQALQHDSQNALAHYNASNALCELGNFPQALSACEQAIRLDPTFPLTYTNKSWALIELGKYQEALNACNQALQLNPNSAMAHHNASVALIKIGNYRLALKACEQALRLDPSHAKARTNQNFLRQKLRG